MAEPLTLLSAANFYQARTSPEKLRGQFYTPPDLVAMMFDALPAVSGSIIIDPACGDGSFLYGAVAALARRFGTPRASTAREWARRIIGFDLDGGAVAAARLALQKGFREYCHADLATDEIQIHQGDVLSHRLLAGILRSAASRPQRRESS